MARLNDETAFSLTDVDLVGEAIGVDPHVILERAIARASSTSAHDPRHVDELAQRRDERATECDPVEDEPDFDESEWDASTRQPDAAQTTSNDPKPYNPDAAPTEDSIDPGPDTDEPA